MAAIKPEQVYSLAHGSFAGTYVEILAEIPHDTVEIAVLSTCDAAVMLSLDGGTTDHEPVPAASSKQLIWRANESHDRTTVAGNAIHVKDIGTPTAGSVYIMLRRRA